MIFFGILLILLILVFFDIQFGQIQQTQTFIIATKKTFSNWQFLDFFFKVFNETI